MMGIFLKIVRLFSLLNYYLKPMSGNDICVFITVSSRNEKKFYHMKSVLGVIRGHHVLKLINH